MKLSVFFICMGVIVFGLCSCSHHFEEDNEFSETYASSVSTSEYRRDIDIPNFNFYWTTLEMFISDGKAQCLLRNMETLYWVDSRCEVYVKVLTSQRVVRVMIEYQAKYMDYRYRYQDISFTLEDLPRNDFVFEVICSKGGESELNSPHIREIIHVDDPKNSHLIFPFERYPDGHLTHY